MKDLQANIIHNKEIATNIFELKLQFQELPQIVAGQFTNIKIPELFLRRPISICDYDLNEKTIILIYKVIGEGTKCLSALEKGSTLDLLMPLGNGFQISKLEEKKPKNILIAGGGVGIPPLYILAKTLIRAGYKPNIVLGYATKAEVFYLNQFEALNLNFKVTTDDGSFAEKGFVTDSIKKYFPKTDYLFTCGPKPMLKALSQLKIPDGQYSFEERMGCGFGGCMGSSIKTNTDKGYKRVCLEGPIFMQEEIVW